MKDILKAILIKFGLFDFAKRIGNKLKGTADKSKNERVLEDELRFSSTSLSPTDFDSLAFSIRMQIHLLEKTLVKGDIEKINTLQLSRLLEKTQRVIDLFPDYSKDADLIVETLGILKTVGSFMADSAEVDRLYNDFAEKNELQQVIPHIIEIKRVGSDYVKAWDNADEFFSTRHSVRAFQKKTVDASTVKEIIELAIKCPSACNRQPWRVYYTEQSDKIEGFKPNPAVTRDIYNFLIVTVNKNMFASSELLQGWINGGIFLESLVMAIHAKGMGSCLFQEIKGSVQYENIKKIAGIPENEDIVALIGFGYLKDEYPIIETHRKSANEILVQF